MLTLNFSRSAGAPAGKPSGPDTDLRPLGASGRDLQRMLFAPHRSSRWLFQQALEKFLAYQMVFDILISLLFASLFFSLWPTNLIYDDGGIILRYMDNFAQGYFYSYNPADGPIFGISGFLHGIVSGTFAYLHILSPLNSLFASNYLGLFLVSLVSLRLLSHYTKNPLLVYPAWALLMSACPHFVTTVKQGLETPLHLAVILLCFYLFLRNKTSWMWLCFVLAIISKLDAVPIVFILGLLFLIRLYPFSRQEITTQAKQLLLYGVIPGVLWIAFTFVIFDGPLPQAAFAKLYYHPRSSGNWFPFFFTWFGQMRFIFCVFCLLFCGYLAFSFLFKKRSSILSVLPFGFSVFGYFGLYYFYNPGEQMSWYYAAPEFLIVLQIIVVMLAVTDLASLKLLVALEERVSGEGDRQKTVLLQMELDKCLS